MNFEEFKEKLDDLLKEAYVELMQNPPEEEHVWRVGDEVKYRGEFQGFMLVPNYKDNEHIILLSHFTYPQCVQKSQCEFAGFRSDVIRNQVRLAYEALEEEEIA